MENELSYSNYGMMMEMSSEQIANCYFQTNWDNANDQNDPFESALSSMVSSPTSTPPTTAPSSNGRDVSGMMIKELIGRLGTICNDGEISPQKSSIVNNSTNTSCYSTPLNSPPPSRINFSPLMMMGNNHNNHGINFPANHHLGSLSADPAFVERAAKFSCFGNNVNINHHVNHSFSVDHHINGRLSSPENGELGGSREGSSVSGVELPSKVVNEAHHSRKRKSVPQAKLKDALVHTPLKDDKVEEENKESNSKRSKVNNEDGKENSGELNCGKNEKNNNNNNNNNKSRNNNDNNSKDAEKPEPPKDYIHVRAKRGQATDSHSLAERARREKISERMKFLQDLVPGCNKVTGKATVLDEIINYVQSLQRQVEFLSMKLSTVNPRMEFNMEALLSSSKDMLQSRGTSLPQAMYPLEQNPAQAFPFGYQSTHQMPMPSPNGVPTGIEHPFSVNPMNVAGIRRNMNVPLSSVDILMDSMNQLPSLWEDDLHSIVQMGIVQNQTQSVPGAVPNAQMKAEL